MFGEPMILKTFKKVNSKLKIFKAKNNFQPCNYGNYCNVPTQPHYDYAWKLKNLMQSKCIHFCFQLDKTSTNCIKELKDLN